MIRGYATAVDEKWLVFWDMTPCGLALCLPACCLHLPS